MKANNTKKQHFIAQCILELFFGNRGFYEILISKGNIIPTTAGNAMELNYFYELPELEKNRVEDFFANSFDNNLKMAVEEIIKNIENIDYVYNILKEKLCLFIIGYYKSYAYVTENTNDLLAKKDENAIRKMLSNIFDKNYIEKLCNTIISGYDFCIIKSNGKFLISDQYIATASLNVKNQFTDMSNRTIGLKDTLLLIPITNSYYIAFKNGNLIDFLTPNTINILDDVQVQLINNVIFKNSYLKVAGKNDTELQVTYKKCESNNLDRTQCMGIGFFYNNKKEVFFYDNDYNIFDMYRSLEFGRYLKLNRNDKCLCGSGKKYKKCCLEKVKACETMYRMLEKRDRNPYIISDELIIEKNM